MNWLDLLVRGKQIGSMIAQPPIVSDVEADFAAAVAQHEAGRVEEAERLYRALLDRVPNHADAFRHLALLQVQKGRLDEAERLFRRAVELDPGSAEAHNCLGGVLQALARQEEAVEWHRRATEIDPDYAEAFFDWGVTLQGMNRPRQSAQCYEKAIVAHPDYPEAHFNLGIVLETLGRWNDAAAAYETAIGLRPDYQRGVERLAELRKSIDRRASARFGEYVNSFMNPQIHPRFGTYPGLSSQPWHEPSDFPIVGALEAAYAEIRQEIGGLEAASFHPEIEGMTQQGSWDVFMFYERGKKQEDNCARCPTIARIIDSHPTVRTLAGIEYVSKMIPGTRVAPHRGPTNIRLRCHLGVRIPTGDCGIRVGTEMRKWEEGRCLVFDDSFEHEAWNASEADRIVLIIDLWHPDLTPKEIAFLEGLHRFGAYQAQNLARYWAKNEQIRLQTSGPEPAKD